MLLAAGEVGTGLEGTVGAQAGEEGEEGMRATDRTATVAASRPRLIAKNDLGTFLKFHSSKLQIKRVE